MTISHQDFKSALNETEQLQQKS